MNAVEKILHKDESILVAADISKTFYNGILSLYALGASLLFISYEYEIGVIGIVLILRLCASSRDSGEKILSLCLNTGTSYYPQRV